MAARLTQQVIEVGELPTETRARLSQAVAEVGQLPANPRPRITQMVLETARLWFPNVAITQLVVEVAVGPHSGQPFEEHGLMLTADRWT